MKHYLLISILSFLQLGQITFDVDLDFNRIYSDNLNRTYLTKGSELSVYDEGGKRLYTYNELSLGEIEFVDVNRSLKPLLFFKEVQAIVLLDNTLSKQAETIYPGKSGYSNVDLVCHSGENFYWFFERDNYEFIRVNRQMQAISKSGNLVLLLGRTIEPDYMMEKDNLLYVKDPKKGIYVFDIYANWVKTIPLNVEGKFEVYKNSIYYHKEGIIYKYDQENFLEKPLEINVKSIEDFSIELNRIFIKNRNKVHVLKTNKS